MTKASARILSGILLRFAGLQIVVQAVSAAVGLLIVRSLSRADYAAYSVSTAVVAGCAVIAHSGFSSTVLARGAQVRHDREQLSRLVASAAAYRLRVTISLVVIGVGTLLVMLHRIGMGVHEAALLAVATGATIALGSGVAVNNDLLALEYRRSLLQGLGLLGVTLRAAGQAVLEVTRTASAVSTAALQVAAIAIVRHVQRRGVRRHIDYSGSDLAEMAHVRRSFRQLLPGNMIFVAQSQIVLLLLALLGQGGTVADVGAVSRYTLFFGLLVGTIGGVVVPMAARASRKDALRVYVGVCVSVCLVGCAAVGCAFAATGPMLALLGDQYGTLGTPLRIIVVGAALAALTDVMSSLNQARGWLSAAWIQLPGVLLTVAIVISVVDVRSATGASALSASLVAPGLVTQTVQLALGARVPLEPVLTRDESMEAVR